MIQLPARRREGTVRHCVTCALWRRRCLSTVAAAENSGVGIFADEFDMTPDNKKMNAGSTNTLKFWK